MSLEAAILDHAAAIRELAAAIRGGAHYAPNAGYQPKPNDTAPASDAPVDAPRRGRPPKTETAPQQEPAAPAAVAQQEAAPKAEAPQSEVRYEDIQALVIKHVAAKRKLIEEFNAEYGVPNAKALKPEQFADYFAGLKQKLEG